MNSYLNNAPKIADFCYRIVNTNHDFRETVLESLAVVFNYHRCTFWFVDTERELYSPKYINISDRIMHAWADNYYKYDPFYYVIKNNAADICRGPVILSEIVNVSEYLANNRYYKEILSEQNYDKKMILSLNNGKRIIGIMSFLRNKDEKPFNHYDKELLQYLSIYISKLFSTQVKIDKQAEKLNLCNDFIDLSSEGLVIANRNGEICYSNKAARQIFEYLQKSGKLASINDLIEVLKLQKQKMHGINHMTYCEAGGYGIRTQERKFLNRQYYGIYFNKLPELNCSPIISDNMVELRHKLTRRENEILDCVLYGMTNAQISDKLFVSIPTVKVHLTNIFSKMSVNNRASLISKFIHV